MLRSQAQLSFFPLPPALPSVSMSKAVGVNSQKIKNKEGTLGFFQFLDAFFYFSCCHHRYTGTSETQICENKPTAQNIGTPNFPHLSLLVHTLLYASVGQASDFFRDIFRDINYTGANPYVDKNLAEITVFHKHNIFQLMSQNTL